MAKEIKADCFAYRASRDGSTDGSCVALRVLDCHNCSFYKKRGTECNKCFHKDTAICKTIKCAKHIIESRQR